MFIDGIRKFNGNNLIKIIVTVRGGASGSYNYFGIVEGYWGTREIRGCFYTISEHYIIR